MGLREIHNMTPIDKEIEQKVLTIREQLKHNAKLTEKQSHILNVAYKAITGKNPPLGCQSCNSVIKIVNNWLSGFYDKQQKEVSPVQEDDKPTYKELLSKAKELGFIKEGKGRTKIDTLKQYIKDNG